MAGIWECQLFNNSDCHILLIFMYSFKFSNRPLTLEHFDKVLTEGKSPLLVLSTCLLKSVRQAFKRHLGL